MACHGLCSLVQPRSHSVDFKWERGLRLWCWLDGHVGDHLDDASLGVVKTAI